MYNSPRSLSFRRGMLIWPLLDGQTQGSYGSNQGSGYGTGGGGTGGGGGGQCQSYDGDNIGFSANPL